MPPSLDFSRPGRTWYPTLGRHRFPIWKDVSTWYHEGVPGHHLQLAGGWRWADRLSRYQRAEHVSGDAEGWALYAERLMDELGFLTAPDRRLGFLSAQQLRATRVVVDIGMHCEMEIPTGQPFHPGERWTPELGREFLLAHGGPDPDFLESEWLRYLGWPGQAIGYKLGERVWLAGRDGGPAAPTAPTSTSRRGTSPRSVSGRSASTTSPRSSPACDRRAGNGSVPTRSPAAAHILPAACGRRRVTSLPGA